MMIVWMSLGLLIFPCIFKIYFIFKFERVGLLCLPANFLRV